MNNVVVVGFGEIGICHANLLRYAKDFLTINSKDDGVIKHQIKENFYLKGVYDHSENNQKKAKDLGFFVYDSYDDVLKDDNVNIIVCATPTSTHKDIVIKALSYNKHVICEKPATKSVEDLQEIIDIANKNNLKFTVNQTRRFDNTYQMISESINCKEIEDIKFIESRVQTPNGMRGWRSSKNSHGGMLLDWGCHLVDQALLLTQEQLVSIYCKLYYTNTKEVEDGFKIILNFENDLEILLECSCIDYIPHPRWKVIGKTTTLTIDNWYDEGYKKSLNDKQLKFVHKDTTNYSTIIDFYYNFHNAINNNCDLIVTHEQLLQITKVLELARKSSEHNILIHCD